MGAGDPKTKARRNRRKLVGAMAGLPELAPAPRDTRKKQGRARMQELPQERAEDAQRTALEARCRHIGTGTTREDRNAVSGPLSASPVLWCLNTVLGDARQKGSKARQAYDAWCGYTAAMRRYELRILGRSVHAKTAALEMEPNRVETETHHTIDDRDEATKDRDAVTAYTRWKGLAWEIGAPAARLIEEVRARGEDDLWQDAAPTRKGLAVAYALRDLGMAAEGR